MIVSLVTAIDPGHVVLGGPLADTVLIADDLAHRIRAEALTELTIAVSPLGQNAPLDGTAISALELARGHQPNRTRAVTTRTARPVGVPDADLP